MNRRHPTRWQRFLCKLGWHDWYVYQPSSHYDDCDRECKRCGKERNDA